MPQQHQGGGGGHPGPSFPEYSGSVDGGYYMNNLLRTAQFLMSNGYNRTSAAGIAGTIAGESSGDPEVYNGMGLIQWTPASKAAPKQPIFSGDPQSDFDSQLTDILYYNNTNGPVHELKNYSGSPVEAADFYSQQFERPLVTDSDVRSSVANDIYARLEGYKPDSAYTEYGAGGGGGSGGGGRGGGGSSPVSQVKSALGPLSGASNLVHGVAVVLDRFFAFFAPGQGWRLAFGITAVVCFLLAWHAFTGGGISVGPVTA